MKGVGPRAPRWTPQKPLFLAVILLLISGTVLWWPAGASSDARGPKVPATSSLVRRSNLRVVYANDSLDDPRQRSALLDIYNATGGPAWSVANASVPGASPWGTDGVSYCR